MTETMVFKTPTESNLATTSLPTNNQETALALEAALSNASSDKMIKLAADQYSELANSNHKIAINQEASGFYANTGDRTLEELKKLVHQDNFNPTSFTNEEIIKLIDSLQISIHRLEKILGKNNAKRCVEIRRQYYTRELERLDDQQKRNYSLPNAALDESNNNATTVSTIAKVAQQNVESRSAILKQPLTSEFDFRPVVNACCENVIGYVSVPVAAAGPLKLDDHLEYVPMATTEGCLVASTNRGLLALTQSGGVMSRVYRNCMTRAPIVRFQDPDFDEAVKNRIKAECWLQDPVNKEKIKTAFCSTSKHTTSLEYTLESIGREMHIRFTALTGDAMGMNMCSKGAEQALKELQRVFPTMDILTLSGNMCTDKKPSAVNWICGRGKSVECYASLPAEVVERILKVSVDSLIKVWSSKVMVGSALAGSVGGFNCHAANIVAAIFLATGQDVAQVVSSSNCIIHLEKDSRGSLEVSCKMPSIECGTVGGGTVLPQQSGYLQMMGIRGSTKRANNDEQVVSAGEYNCTDSDSNACKLARIICSTVMAGELSLLASLTQGTLVSSHMTHNRSAQPCNVV